MPCTTSLPSIVFVFVEAQCTVRRDFTLPTALLQFYKTHVHRGDRSLSMNVHVGSLRNEYLELQVSSRPANANGSLERRVRE